LSEDEVSKKVQQLVKEANKKLAAILTKDQAKRLKQIVLQIQGPFVDPAAAKELKITNEQKEKFKKLQSKAKKEMLKIFESAKGNFKDIMTKQREMAKKMNETVLKLLTDEQKAKWKAMTGKPFKGEIQPMTYTCKSISSQDASPLFSCQKQMAVAVRLQSLLRPRGRLRQTEDDAGEMK
jgi:vacuolar-type H+-ATPase subunit H